MPQFAVHVKPPLKLFTRTYKWMQRGWGAKGRVSWCLKTIEVHWFSKKSGLASPLLPFVLWLWGIKCHSQQGSHHGLLHLKSSSLESCIIWELIKEVAKSMERNLFKDQTNAREKNLFLGSVGWTLTLYSAMNFTSTFHFKVAVGCNWRWVKWFCFKWVRFILSSFTGHVHEEERRSSILQLLFLGCKMLIQ